MRFQAQLRWGCCGAVDLMVLTLSVALREGREERAVRVFLAQVEPESSSHTLPGLSPTPHGGCVK